jgi:prophage DNA circulation protein
MAPFNKTSHGLPQVVLVILLAWALTAVVILTGILINAREIDRRVVYINTQLTPINKHVGYIALAGKTNVIASKILAAVPTLAPGLQKTDDYVNSIDKTAKTILSTAKQINTKVLGIGGTVTTIHATVGSIHSTVTSIHSLVTGSITPKLTRTGNDVTQIRSSVNAILSTAQSILNSVQSGIQPAVVSINGKADAILADVAGTGDQILPDFVAINGLVGRSPTDPHTINGHANDIDCSGLINLTGATKACGKQ